MNLNLKRLSLVTAALALAAVFMLPATVTADEWNLKTYLTFSGPVQVPGAVLQPNVKYVLRRLDGNAGTNHVVRVMNADETEVISTFFGISDQRLEPADDTVITFYETAAGFPKPVKSWFYPGRTIGMEFLYSAQEKQEIAAHMVGAQAVQTARAAEPETFVQEPAPAPSEEIAAKPEAPVEENAIAENTEIQREKPSETLEENKNPAPESTTNTETTSNTELPRTAGELPLLGLLGVAALALRQVLKKG